MSIDPIFIVDDDVDDQDFIKTIWAELHYDNPLIFFQDSEKVLFHLKSDPTVPFIILCDINVDPMNGFELKKKIQEDPNIKYKSVPFIFWSTSASNEQVKKAYDLGGNGFFIKENRLEDLKKSFIKIVEYWFMSKVPV
jgi:CheY-like chemotaxis protein